MIPRATFSRLVIRRALLSVLLLMTLAAGPCATAAADTNLLRNGDLTQGAGDQPAEWSRVGQLYMGPSEVAATFGWRRPSGAPAELRLTNSKRRVLRWDQNMRLEPGLYYLSGEMRTEGLAPMIDVASIAVQLADDRFGVQWHQVANPSNWENGGLYFKVGKSGRNVDIVCRLEGRGTAFFRQIKLVRLSNPPPAGVDVVDLSAFPEVHEWEQSHPYNPPSGRPWTLFLTLFVLASITVSAWIALGPRRG